jgi:hypothetical protein
VSDKSLTKIPLPPGFLWGGSKKGITAELLDRHENLVISTVRNGQETAKIVSVRLQNRLKKEGAKWMPDPEFMRALEISAKVTTMLSAEYRQLRKIKSAGELSDEELLGMMKPLLLAVLDAMSDEEFAIILDERERVKRGETSTYEYAADAEIVDE